jgi:hypothetical protein
MPATYYAAVEGDPLTSGKGSYIFPTKKTIGDIRDQHGKPRRIIFIGDEGYCASCRSTGVITYGAGVSKGRRMVDMVNGGRLQAVGGDIVLCKCATPPRIIAVYGQRWMIHDKGDSKERATPQTVSSKQVIYDEQFTVTDARGNALANTYYTVRLHTGEWIHGVTDSRGRTGRYATGGAQRIHLYLGHRGQG